MAYKEALEEAKLVRLQAAICQVAICQAAEKAKAKDEAKLALLQDTAENAEMFERSLLLYTFCPLLVRGQEVLCRSSTTLKITNFR